MKSIDAETDFETLPGSGLASSTIMRDANNNSIFGGAYRPKFALNPNTTIELAEPAMSMTQRTGEGSIKSPFA